MIPALKCLAIAFVGVDLGYQPTTNGRVEFIIQISPAMLQTLRPGDPIDVDADPQAQSLRPSHFTITTGSGPLPHILPATSSVPGTAPIVQATPVMPAYATMPTSQESASAGTAPQYGLSPRSSIAHPGPVLNNYNPSRSQSAIDSGHAKFAGLQQLDSTTGSPPDHPWLGMCLLVIALAAFNGYVGWLFWDARKRYLDLVRQRYPGAHQVAEA